MKENQLDIPKDFSATVNDIKLAILQAVQGRNDCAYKHKDHKETQGTDEMTSDNGLEMKDLDANEMLAIWDDPERQSEVEAWLAAACAGVRRETAALRAAEERAKTTKQDSPDVTMKEVRVEDATDTYVPRADFADVFAASAYVREARLTLPPEETTPDEAVFYLARAELYHLIYNFTQTLIFSVGAQRNLHAAGRGLGEFEIKNLFCEPGDNNESHYAWLAIFLALHNAYPHTYAHEAELDKLCALFRNVADIYYNLTEAVYTTNLVLDCRRAFAAFWRSLGKRDFAPRFNDFAAKRQALDTAIVNGQAPRFQNLEATMLEMAQAFLAVRQDVASLKSPETPVAQRQMRSDGGDAQAACKKRGPHGPRKTIPVQYAADVYGKSKAAICAWDKGEGGVPNHYPGRDVDIDTFDAAVAEYHRAIGHQEGVISRVTSALQARRARQV